MPADTPTITTAFDNDQIRRRSAEDHRDRIYPTRYPMRIAITKKVLYYSIAVLHLYWRMSYEFSN